MWWTHSNSKKINSNSKFRWKKSTHFSTHLLKPVDQQREHEPWKSWMSLVVERAYRPATLEIVAPNGCECYSPFHPRVANWNYISIYQCTIIYSYRHELQSTYLIWPFISFITLFGCKSTTESLLCSLSGLMLLLTSSIGSALTSSDERAGGEGVKLSLSVDDPKLPPPLPFVVKLIVSFRLLLLLWLMMLLCGTLLFVLNVLLLLPLRQG